MPDISPGKDCYLQMNDETTWALARDATTAETASINVSAGYVRISGAGSKYDVYRAFFAFDTSGISTAPASATLRVYGQNYSGADLIAVAVDPSATGDSSTDWADTDFAEIVGYVAGSTMSGNVTEYSAEYSPWLLSQYNDIVLTSAALADMASLSEFKLALVSYDYDYLNAAPPASTYRSKIKFMADTAAKRPHISYVEGVAANDTISGRALAGTSLAGTSLSGGGSDVS